MHATSSDVICSDFTPFLYFLTGVKGITENGFRLPKQAGMYGAGIYLATDSSKSAQNIYTKVCGNFLSVTHNRTTLRVEILHSFMVCAQTSAFLIHRILKSLNCPCV